MKRFILPIALAAAAATTPAGATHDVRTIERTYTAGSRFPASNIGGPCLPNYVSGAPADGNHVCAITLKGDEVSVSVTLQDAAGWAVGGTIDFWGSTFVSEIEYCGSSGEVPIPAGATKVQFKIHGPGGGVNDASGKTPCVSLAPLNPGFATYGTATVSFRLKDA